MQPMVPCPPNRIIKILLPTNDIRFPLKVNEVPIPNWDPNMVQPGRSDLAEIVLGYPCVPVVLKRTRSCVSVLVLTEGVLIDDTGV